MNDHPGRIPGSFGSGTNENQTAERALSGLSNLRWDDPLVNKRGQVGAALPLALVATIVLATILIPLAWFAATATKSTGPYVVDSQKRAAGDGAIKAAINFVSRNEDIGRDRDVFPDDPACGYWLPKSVTGSVDVAVTCDAVAGTESGVPEDTGKVPDQALLLLGQRYGEPGMYSPCTGVVTRSGAANAQRDRADWRGREVGLLLDTIALKSDSGTIKCDQNTGAINDDTGFKVRGDIRSNAPVRTHANAKLTVDDGTIEAGTSPLYNVGSNPAGCSGIIRTTDGANVPCDPIGTDGNRAAPSSGDSADPFNPGEHLFTDPALDAARGDEWRQGTVNWSAPKVSFNGATPIPLTGTTPISCDKDRNLIRFYPGFYQSAYALNRIFATDACSKGKSGNQPGVFWFGPAEDKTADNTSYSPSTFSLDFMGEAGKPTEGVYTFDFRDTANGQACGMLTNTNNLHRWCLYKSNTDDNGPVVIGGWPSGWDPAGIIAEPADVDPDDVSTVVRLDDPTNVNTNGSITWDNPNNIKVPDDGNVTYYWPQLGFSADRSITVSGFGTTAAVQSGGTITFAIRHQESNSDLLDKPRMELTTTDRGVPVHCGTYTVPKSTDTHSLTADALRTDYISTDPAVNTTTPALGPSQEQQLRSCFINGERIKNFKVKWIVSGDPFNKGRCVTPFDWAWLAPVTCVGGDHPTKPRVFIDGIKITVEVPTGGFFSPDVPPPGMYCDPKKPGVQFIFGGDSTVHTSSAGMQLCAGPAPHDPEDYQQIALWGQPTNFLTKKTASGQKEVRVGKAGPSTLRPTSARAGWTYCGPIFLGIGCFKEPRWLEVATGIKTGTPYTNPAKPGTPVTAVYKAGRAVTTKGYIDVGGFGKVKDFGDGVTPDPSKCTPGDTDDQTKNLCMDYGSQQISKILLKAAYNSDCGAFGLCGSLSGAVDYRVYLETGNSTLCSGQFPPNGIVMWYTVNITSCMGSTAATRLTNVNRGDLRVSLTFVCNTCIDNEKLAEGVELLVDIASKDSPSNPTSITPATGCRWSPSGYGTGSGDADDDAENVITDSIRGPDCALVSGTAPLMSGGVPIRIGGRVSVQGTIYAPSDALEIADGDVMYPFASRGLVARHLRVRAMHNRFPYEDPSVDTEIDKSVPQRVVEFTACIRSRPTDDAAAVTELETACGDKDGDVILTRAGVVFKPETAASATNTQVARVPQVLWWDSHTDG